MHLVTAHTADLDQRALGAIRALLFEVFDDATDDDYEHALGGMHVCLWDGDELVAHGSVVLRRLLHGERALRAGYVEAVFVRGDVRRQGHGATVMDEIERIVRGGYELGALGATDEAVAFYEGRGWQAWRGTASIISRDGAARSPDDEGAIFVLRNGVDLDVDGDLACGWREGDAW